MAEAQVLSFDLIEIVVDVQGEERRRNAAVEGGGEGNMTVGGDLLQLRGERPVASKAGEKQVVVVLQTLAVVRFAEKADEGVGLGVEVAGGMRDVDDLAGVESNQGTKWDRVALQCGFESGQTFGVLSWEERRL